MAHAHANCVENLPLFAAVILVADLTGKLDATDPLAGWYLALRIGQSTAHLLGTSLCAFNPDIALRFWRGKSRVDVVVCLGCSEDVFYTDKGQSLDGGSFADFTILSRIAKKTFPKEEFGY